MKLSKFVPALIVVEIVVMACGETNGSGATAGKKIALLLPETTTARFDTKDRPYFEAKLKQICSDCKVLYSSAKQDAAQQTQAEAAIANGAGVIVLDPIDGAAAAAIVTKAKAANIRSSRMTG